MARLEPLDPDETVSQPGQVPTGPVAPQAQQQGQPEIQFTSHQLGQQEIQFTSQQHSQPEIQSLGDVSSFQVVGEPIVVGDPWTTDLFDCHKDQKSAIMATFLPCVTFGQIAQVLDDGDINWMLAGYIYLVMMPALCSYWLMGSRYRAKLRKKYNLAEAPHPDIVVHAFCPCCALAQEFRELRIRGLDPAQAMKGNGDGQQAHINGRQNVGIPPQTQYMSR